MKSIVILYHKGCPDGFGAAWVAWKKFGTRAEYIAIDPKTLPKEKLENSTIFVLDNSFPREVQEMLQKNNKRVVVIDHHESSEDEIRSFPQNVFDMKHSGAVLTWKYVYPKKQIPLMLKYIEDRDLWKFNLSYSEEISSFLESYDFDFKKWSFVARKIENTKTRKEAIMIGSYLLRYKNEVIKRLMEKAYKVAFGGYETFAVNSSEGRFTSELGHRLSEQFPPLAIIWHVTRSQLLVSLRSNGTVDVSKIAQRFGGGGHSASAGFSMAFKGEFPWKILIK